jgi:hypothetical protein
VSILQFDPAALTGGRLTLSASRLPSESAMPQAVARSAAVASNKPEKNGKIDFGFLFLKIYKETDNYLGSLGRAASEGRGVDEANNFLRWLQFSGILRLLEMDADENPNYRTLRHKADDLQEICKPHLQGRNIKDSPNQARIDEVNAKVDAILSILAKDVTPPLPQLLKVLDVGGTQV